MPRSTSSVLKKKCPKCPYKSVSAAMMKAHKQTHKGVRVSGQKFTKRVVPKKGSIAYILNRSF